MISPHYGPWPLGPSGHVIHTHQKPCGWLAVESQVWAGRSTLAAGRHSTARIPPEYPRGRCRTKGLEARLGKSSASRRLFGTMQQSAVRLPSTLVIILQHGPFRRLQTCMLCASLSPHTRLLPVPGLSAHHITLADVLIPSHDHRSIYGDCGFLAALGALAENKMTLS